MGWKYFKMHCEAFGMTREHKVRTDESGKIVQVYWPVTREYLDTDLTKGARIRAKRIASRIICL